MKPKKRQKLCHNCEGEIDLDVIVCPFCAADLREEKPEQLRPPFGSAAFSRNLNEQQTMQESLYPPPYVPRSTEQEPLEERISAAPLEEEKGKDFIGPTILFTLGVQLFLFGLLILLFSHEGMIFLKWEARFWFLYIFASVPFLVLGYKALSKL